MSSRPTIAIVGASTNRKKFGNKAVRAYKNAGYDVYPINLKAGEIEGLTAYRSLDELPLKRLDMISLYLPPATLLVDILDQVARKESGEVWLNPGTATKDVVAKAESLGLHTVQACSILALGEHPDRL